MSVVKGVHACKQQGLDGRRLGNIETELEGQFHASISLTLEASGKICNKASEHSRRHHLQKHSTRYKELDV